MEDVASRVKFICIKIIINLPVECLSLPLDSERAWSPPQVMQKLPFMGWSSHTASVWVSPGMCNGSAGSAGCFPG